MHKMVYPENFESKIKFDKIRQFVQKKLSERYGQRFGRSDEIFY